VGNGSASPRARGGDFMLGGRQADLNDTQIFTPMGVLQDGLGKEMKTCRFGLLQAGSQCSLIC